MNKKIMLLFIISGLIFSNYSYANSKDKEDEVFFEFVDEVKGYDVSENVYNIGNIAIAQDEYGIVANNMDKLDENYIISDKIFDMNIEDSLEPFNRRVYALNTELDKKILYPASRAYATVIPKGIRQGIANFSNNFSEIPTFVNSVLQLKFDKSFNSLGRFTVNSTLGIAGISDVASKMGLKQDKETMGDTLAKYGVGYGSYLVLPVLGPSTVRDGIGTAIDSTMEGEARKAIFEDPALYDNGVKQKVYGPARTVVTGLNARSLINFKYGDFNSPFEYDLVKIFYTNFRKIQIKK